MHNLYYHSIVAAFAFTLTTAPAQTANEISTDAPHLKTNNLWCRYKNRNGQTVIETQCSATLKKQENCIITPLDGQYTLQFSDTSTAQIVEACDAAPPIKVNGKETQDFARVTINGRSYFSVTLTSGETFEFEALNGLRWENTSPWSSSWEAKGQAGYCFLKSSNVQDECQRTERCDINYESGEGSCSWTFRNNERVLYSLHRIEESYTSPSNNISFAQNDIRFIQDTPCYPAGKNDHLCFSETTTKNIDENIDLGYEILKIIKINTNTNTRYYSFTPSELKYSSKSEFLKELNNYSINKLTLEPNFFSLTGRGRGVLCSIREKIAEECVIHLGLGFNPVECESGWEYAHMKTEHSEKERYLGAGNAIPGTIIGCSVETSRGTGLFAQGFALFHLKEKLNYIGYFPEKEYISGWGLGGTANLTSILSVLSIGGRNGDGFYIESCPNIAFETDDSIFKFNEDQKCELYWVATNKNETSPIITSGTKKSLNSSLQESYKDKIKEFSIKSNPKTEIDKIQSRYKEGGSDNYYNQRFGYQIEIPPTFSEVIEPANGDGGVSRSLEGNAELSVWGHHIIKGDFRTEIESRIASSEEQGWKISYNRSTDHWASWSGSKGNRVFYQRAIPLCDNHAAQFRLEYDRVDLKSFDPIVERLVGTFTFDSDCRKSSSRVEVSPTWQVRDNGVYALDDDSRSIELGGTFARSNLDRFLGEVDAKLLRTEGEDCGVCYYITLNDGGIFIDSNGTTISLIEVYGTAFTDSYGFRVGDNISRGTSLYCTMNGDSGEQHCRKEKSSGVSWMIESDADCNHLSVVLLQNGLKRTKFAGCEAIAGFSQGGWYWL